MNIKEIIQRELFTKTGKINSAILRREWFLNGELYKEINKLILFSDDISEKIYCIMNGIIERPKCPICRDKELNFYTYQLGYHKTCNNFLCKRKNNKSWKSCSMNKKINYKQLINNFSNKYKNRDFNKINEEDIMIYVNNKIKNIKNKFVGILSYSNESDELCNILEYTKDILDIVEGNFRWSERFYILKNNLKKIPECKICGKKLSYNNFNIGYSTVCNSSECINFLSQVTKYKNKYNDICSLAKKQDFEVLTLIDEFKGVNNTNIILRCNKCNNIIERDLKNGKSYNIYCYKCYGYSGRSKMEDEIIEFLKQYNIEVLANIKTIISPLELDIYIPSKKIAIELDGIYWHSEQFIKDNMYHLNKTLECEKNGITLYHIFSNEWEFKQDIIKSILLSKLGIYGKRIYGRECEIDEVSDKKLKVEFLNMYHLQGNCNSKYDIGLWYRGELVSMMSFGKRQITRGKINMELLRYCVKNNTQIIGGASKLLRYFENKYKFDTLVTYADRRYSSGNLYYQLGFRLDHISKPNYWYIINNNLKHRIFFQKHKLSTFLNEGYDENLTEYENMYNAGFYRIWDCGNYVFYKKYNK